MKRSYWSILLVIAMIFWASGYAFVKTIVSDIEPLQLAFLRYFFASILLLPLLVFSKKNNFPPKKTWPALLALSIVGWVVVAPLFILGLGMTNTTVSSILVNTNPLFIALFAPYLISERLRKRKIFALVLGFIGVVVVVLNGESILTLIQSDYLLGSIVLLVVALSVAIYSIYVKPYIVKYGGLSITVTSTLFAALVLVPLCVMFGLFTELFQFSERIYFYAFLYGSLGTAIPVLIWASSMKHMKASIASSFKLLIPVFVMVISVLFLQEELTIWIVGGLILTSISLYFVQEKQEPVLD